MECPPGCPARVFALMRECWHWGATNRPTFRQMPHDMENMFQVRWLHYKVKRLDSSECREARVSTLKETRFKIKSLLT